MNKADRRAVAGFALACGLVLAAAAGFGIYFLRRRSECAARGGVLLQNMLRTKLYCVPDSLVFNPEKKNG